jgi:antitoxin ParD1/3/4
MARDSTLNVSLTSTLRQYVQAKIEAGGYESASEVIRESLRALQDRDKAHQDFWTNVRRKVAVAKKQAADGRVTDGEATMRQIIAELNDKPARKSRGKAQSR